MKQTKFLIARCLTLLVLALLSTNLAWGEISSTSTFTEKTFSQLADGDVVIFASSSSKAMSNATQTTGKPAQVGVTISGNTGSLKITPGSGSLDGIAWTLDAVTGGFTFYQYGSTENRLCITATGSNTAAKVTDATSSYTTMAMGASGKNMQFVGATRFLGCYTSGSDWRTYNTEEASNYGGTSTKFYVLNTAPVSVEAPTFSVAAGNYTKAQTVELSCATEGASIYYTTDGSEPTATSTQYTSAIAVNKSMTIKAIAIKGDDKSSVATAAYKITTYASLADLVADGDPGSTGYPVTVTLINEVITDFYTSSSDSKRHGVYLKVGEKTIEIYCKDAEVPEEWIEGGTVSGTLQNCTWKNYNGTWELCPTNWGSLTYTAPTTYNITIADGIQNGTVKADMEKAAAGVEVTLTVIPDEGYKLGILTVKDATEADVPVEDNKFTMPASDVNVSATFEAIPTHEAKFFVNGVQYGETQNVLEGGEVVFPEEDPAAIGTRTFVGWTASPMDGVSDKAPEFVESATMGTEDLNFYAVFAEKVEGDGTYRKVTSALDDWCGKYLIVYEAENVAFDGSLETLDAASNTKPVTISNDVIASSSEMDAIAFTVAYKTGSSTIYSLKSASGKYISGTTTKAQASNGLKQANTDEDYEISFNGITVESKSSDQQMVLKYNKDTNQKRFRFYKSGQQDIALYKKHEATYSGYCTTVPPRTFAVSVSASAETGLTTMYVDYATEIPEDVEAWYVSAYDATEDKLTMTQINGYVPANTAIIVKGTAGESYNFVETFETVDAISGTNLLTGSVTDSEAQTYTTDDGWYYLATSGNFKKYEGTGIVRKAHKAYLYLTDRTWSQSAKELTIDWGEPTGIKTIDNGQLTIDNSKAYNLNGVRVNNGYKGIVIMNGKKYINK